MDKRKIAITSWNVRGLNSREKREKVRRNLMENKPDILSLQETKIENYSEAIHKEITGAFAKNFNTLNARGTSGGILMAWSEIFKLKSTNAKRFSISITLECAWDGKEIMITGVYGPHSFIERIEFIAELESMAPNSDMPWLILGDFNMVLSIDDRNQTSQNQWRDIQMFREMLNNLKLIDPPHQGRNFTWSNNSAQARLDRALFSLAWSTHFPNSIQMALINTCSDHVPIQLLADTSFPIHRGFRFENYWLKNKEAREIIEEHLKNNKAKNMEDFRKKLSSLGRKLKQWQKNKNANDKYFMSNCKKIIEWVDIKQEIRSLEEIERWLRETAKSRINEMIEKEQCYWKQRAKNKWIKEGDKNTKYFHKCATMRKNKTLIARLKDENANVIVNNHKEKARILFDFYRDLLGKDPPQPGFMSEFNMDAFFHNEKQDFNDLEQEIRIEEMDEVIKRWKPDKSPGPDGFNGEFYKEYWHLLREELWCIVSKGGDMGEFRESYVTLIPKKDHAELAKDYRPISLISSVQKIISKIMANRMKKHIANLILPNQLGFIEKRDISECYIYAREMLNTSHKSKNPLLLFKADIHKAFDTISWEFILKILKARGFGPKWISWMQNWIFGGSTKILLNGNPGKTIHLKRGVRQGDPISPHLFIIAMDTLGRILEKLASQNFIERPIINARVAIFYADDSLFFVKPTIEQAKRLKFVLELFGEQSGLTINYSKSEIAVISSKGEKEEEVAQTLGCQISQLPFTYLGYPLHYKKPDRAVFRALIEKFHKKLQGWKSGLLSKGGRLILINAVLTALPIYFFSVFKIPKWALEEMERIRKNFLWKGHKNTGFHWVSWEKVCRPKEGGGLGVIKLETFNRAMLMKWVWKYFKGGSLDWGNLVSRMKISSNLEGLKREKDSYFWKEIKNLAGFVMSNSEVEVGDGRNISFWYGRWNGQSYDQKLPHLFSYVINREATVEEMVCDNANWRSKMMVRGVLSREAIEECLLLDEDLERVHLSSDPDSLRWKLEKNQLFSSRSAYRKLVLGVLSHTKLKYIWGIEIPLRMKVHLWMMEQNKIATIENLKRKGMQIINRCYLCEKEEESTLHLKGICDFTRKVWSLVFSEVDSKWDLPRSAMKISDAITKLGAKKVHKQLGGLLLFVTWRERCRRAFTERRSTAAQIGKEILEEWRLIERFNSKNRNKIRRGENSQGKRGSDV